MIYRRRGIEAIASDGDVRSPRSRIHHAQSLQPATVALPPLRYGAHFLDHWPVHEEPTPANWRAPFYECVAPALFVLRDAQMHTASGILTIDGDVAEESLVRLDTRRLGIACAPTTVTIEKRPITELAGTHISLLCGGSDNFFHGVMDGAARMATVPPHVLAQASTVLIPADSAGLRHMLSLYPLPPHLQLREVQDGHSLRVETLILPMSVYGVSSYHPIVGAFYDQVSKAVPDDPRAGLPDRFYLDRRGAASRALVNETELIGELALLGYTPIRPETLSIPEQVRLFRSARSIVAPHGAGLTNIGFCRPDCRILELHLDAYVHWGFRHLAALRALSYDCILGRSLPANSPDIHSLRWRISTQHVIAAL